MKIELKNITVRDLRDGYKDKSDTEEGIVGYGGKLDIRPPYQREFVYKGEQRESVIETVRKGFPLNIMYWAVKDDGTYEIIDGQQRTISICQYVTNKFSVKEQKYRGLTDEEQKQILDYELTVYFCTGTAREKLDWFETVNIAGEKLTPQELRNSVYSGVWVTQAKKYFSRTNCGAFVKGGNYVKGVPIQQEYLETAIKWITNKDRGAIESLNKSKEHDKRIRDYMADNQHKPNADELKTYFEKVIEWVEDTFINKNRKKYMYGIEWGFFYNEFKDKNLDPEELEKEIKDLIQDDDIDTLKGIYYYVLTRRKKYLNIRSFDDQDRQRMFERQNGICKGCNEKFDLEEMHADHIKAWSRGGKTILDNGQMLCADCNQEKSNKY